MTEIKHNPEIGAQYYDWTIIHIVPHDRLRERTRVLCLCKCGTEKEMLFSTLVYGGSKRCKTCVAKKRSFNIKPGDQFGNWTVLKEVERIKSGRCIECQCSCGNINKISLKKLKQGRTKSCRKCSNKKIFYKGYKDIPKEFWTNMQNGAKARNIKFDISIEDAFDLFEKQNKKCALSGRELVINVPSQQRKKRTASLDRIDSSKPYSIDNVQWVHKDINIAKQSLSQDDFKSLCKEVTNYRNDHNQPNKWDKRFLDLAYFISSFSKDPSTKVGAVIARGKKEIGLGYNGFPEGITDSDERLHNREQKYRFTVHAEANSIANAGQDVSGCTIYVTMLPCHDCMKMLLTHGIKRIVYPYPTKEHWERWGSSFHDTIEMAKEAGVELVVL